MGLYINRIGVGLAGGFQTVEDALAEMDEPGTKAALFSRLFGLRHLPYGPDEPLGILIGKALADLEAQCPDVRHLLKADITLHCHTIPAEKPFGLRFASGLAEAYAGIGERAAITMAHCASSLLALDLFDALLPQDGHGLLIVGEKAFHRRIRLIADTTIMGEAAVAVRLSRSSGLARIDGVHVSQEGRNAVSTGFPGEEPSIADYPRFLDRHLGEAFERFGIGPDAVDLVLPHNVNVQSWRAAAKRTGLAGAAVYLDNVPRLGHCFGADPFLNLATALGEGRLPSGARALLVAIGMGASASSALVTIQTEAAGFRPSAVRSDPKPSNPGDFECLTIPPSTRSPTALRPRSTAITPITCERASAV